MLTYSFYNFLLKVLLEKFIQADSMY